MRDRFDLVSVKALALFSFMRMQVIHTKPFGKVRASKAHRRILCAILALGPAASAAAAPTKIQLSAAPILLDSVIASVNEKPITLRDLEQRLSPPRKLTIEEAAREPQLQALLDRMIFELAVMSEAESKKIEVDDSEIDRYMEEVAKRNNLTKAGLEKALAEQNKDVSLYRYQIKLDILQSRLGSAYLQSSGAVTQEEIDVYLKEHPELLESGTQVKISRILVSTSTRPDADARARAEEARAKLSEGEPFSAVAKLYSDAPEGREGGSLGLVAEKDLSGDIFKAVMSLNTGQVSEVIKGDSGYMILSLVDRVSGDGSSKDMVVAEVRNRIQSRKQQSKLQDFFTMELFKNHTVEKKI
ncbi:MAG: hypothetical protein EBZ48_06650 [Proteobacteria bacterium]|nr:hypothetical protein [Pseudomonadota bacterium]